MQYDDDNNARISGFFQRNAESCDNVAVHLAERKQEQKGKLAKEFGKGAERHCRVSFAFYCYRRRSSRTTTSASEKVQAR